MVFQPARRQETDEESFYTSLTLACGREGLIPAGYPFCLLALSLWLAKTGSLAPNSTPDLQQCVPVNSGGGGGESRMENRVEISQV